MMGSKRWGGAWSALFVALALARPAAAGEPVEQHGIAVFGDLKYRPGFRHFAYVEPDAPKGGRLRLAGVDSFDTLNPFTLKGVPAQGAGLVFDTLMARAMDEPSALYGLLAEGVTLAEDGSWAEFRLRPEARFHDGSPVTAGDVAFSLETLRARGHPSYRLVFGPVATVEALTPDRVRFGFAPGAPRDIAVEVAALPVLSKAWYIDHPFEETTMTPPLGSGPYRVARLEAGRSIVFARDARYWGRDLPVNRGRYNFDEIRFDYYRDRDVALQAFFAGEYDFREEFTSVSWAKRYDVAAVRDGLIVKESVANRMPSGMQAFFINLRREKFRDRRVREALNLAFDFEWTNRTIFHGLYRRINGVYENSVYAASAPPSAAELALLEPYRDALPKEVFDRPFESPSTDGSGRVRNNLRLASRLLAEAGYRVRDDVLVDHRGRPLVVEFLLAQSSFKRIVLPFVRNLRRLGIDAEIRIVDVNNFTRRRDRFDFDVIMERLPQFLILGNEQKSYFGSAPARIEGSRNISGIESPVVDALLEKLVGAADRDAMIVAARALDRVLMWGYYVIPHWFKATHNIAYWDRFGRPRSKPAFDLGVIDTWWYDPAKAARIDHGEAPKLVAAAVADSGGQLVAGWEEEVRLDRLDFSMRAKLDTGADTSSINTNRIEWLKKEGADHVRFTVEARDGREVTLERKVVRITRIKNLDGPALRRPVVMLGVCLGSVYREIEVNLADRSRFRNRMLLGRNFLKDRVLVDSSRRFVRPPDCTAADGR